MALNGLFIMFTIRKPELQKGYAWFLCGMAATNFIYCSNNSFAQIIVIVLNVNPKGVFCQIVGIILLTNGVGAVCIQPWLALNRFVSLYYSHLQSKLFSSRKNAAVLICTYIVCFIVSVILFVFGDMGRLGNTICGPEVESMAFSHVFLFAVPMFISYGVCIICAYKIFYLLKSHQETARRQALGSRLQDAKEITRLLIIELVVPISLETPVLLLCIVSSQVYIPKIVIAVSVCMFVTHPVFDPLIVVIVMKPYREFVKSAWHKYRGVNAVTPSLILHLTIR